MDTKFMNIAIDAAKEGLKTVGEGPFGACIVRNGEVVAIGNNRVVTETDPSMHAEMTAIRRACKKLGVFHLDGCELYSTCEPCPMCFGAIYWAHISKLYYGTSRFEAAEIGFDDQFIYEELARKEMERKLVATPKVLYPECKVLFDMWRTKADKVAY